jgi:DNA-binding beta-propeller fold protein YncE
MRAALLFFGVTSFAVALAAGAAASSKTAALGTPIKVGAVPTGIAVSPSGSAMYVASEAVNAHNGTVSVVSVLTLVLNSPDVQPVPASLSVLAGTKRRRVVRGLPPLSNDLALSRNGRSIWITSNRANTVSAVRTPEG